MKFKNYSAPNQKLWQGRIDSLPKERFFQVVSCLDLKKRDSITCLQLKSSFLNKRVALIGFACDEGIKRNYGRLGAQDGPDAFRKALGNFALPKSGDLNFYDFGTIVCSNGNLSECQDELSEIVCFCLKQNIVPVVIGGGHDLAFGNYKGSINFFEQDIAIINFDAHFDLRPLINEVSTSGTPFVQIAQLCAQKTLKFDYLCLGIQRVSNTKSLFDKAAELNVSYVLADDFHLQNYNLIHNKIDEVLQRNKYIYLTFCLDVLAQSIAPGVSAPSAIGLHYFQVLPFLKQIMASNKVISLDIAELSPINDLNQQTAKLAASLFHELVFNN